MQALTDQTSAPTWHPGSWRSLPAAQQPPWPDPEAEQDVLDHLARLPGLVTGSGVDALRARLAAAAEGRAFVLQAGDCAERFTDSTHDAVRAKIRLVHQMALVLGHGTGLPVVPIGRIAGQYGKPRSRPTESVRGVELPVYRGDIVNDPAPTPSARRPDPDRMRRAYEHAAATLDAVCRVPDPDPAALHRRTCEVLPTAAVGHDGRAAEIGRALRFATTLGARARHPRVYTSHEALLPAFEEALLRCDPDGDGWIASSAHHLWIGERTRDPEGAHVELLRGVRNPVGVKLGPSATPGEVHRLCERLDPHRSPGRLTLISRMGADVVAERLLPLVEAVAAGGWRPVWLCDPMHGNTVQAPSGIKTRHLSDVLEEIDGFLAAHRLLGTVPGGLHLELTGDDVTECVGGVGGPGEDELDVRYESVCDPRLNPAQALELAFRVADLLPDAPLPAGPTDVPFPFDEEKT